MKIKLICYLFTMCFMGFVVKPKAQELFTLDYNTTDGLFLREFNKSIPDQKLPLFSLLIGSDYLTTYSCQKKNDSTFVLDHRVAFTIKKLKCTTGLKYRVILENLTKDTLVLQNLVPFGESIHHVYISGKGDHWLSRAHLFRPGFEPVNVILPDNAWELGFSAYNCPNGEGICALMRRDRPSVKNGKANRFETTLFPGGSIKYYFCAENYSGDWQNALKLIFQQRLLYDVEPGTFDNSLFERADLKWFRNCYALNIVFNWDSRYYYDYTENSLKVNAHLKKMKKLFGGYDVFSIWPTWPTLGMDQRNQWDLFRDLPGGFKGLKNLSETCEKNNSRLFICYNPWDESTTYKEGHYKGLAKVIGETGAMGVVIDTRNESSRELQEAVDSVQKGVIMYSEGMALPKGMQYIPSGRVHNALYYPPLLNLNKFIKPDFVIFRVAEVYKEKIKREFALSLFNGYGTEINNMPAGNPEWIEDQFRYWGDLIRIQRENAECFNSFDYVPLINTTKDKIYVNKWKSGDKIIYTIFSLIPQGFKGELFKENNDTGFHFVDLYHYEEIEPAIKSDGCYIPVKLESFNQYDLNTNNEGAAGAVARFRKLLKVNLDVKLDKLSFSALEGNIIKIWAGKPSYEKTPLEFGIAENAIKLLEHFPAQEGKFIIQLFDKTELIDEQIVYINFGTARIISKTSSTAPVNKAPDGMVEIPPGQFRCDEYLSGDSFIAYPENPTKKGESILMKRLFMDIFPVTNLQFKTFLDATHYVPSDTNNFLKHWIDNAIPQGQENYPVIYVSYEDAQAYAKWIGKRLPTEIEWQYASQTSMGNQWPWNQKKPVKRVEEEITPTLSVFRLEGIEPGRCNTGDGKMYPVGNFPKGKNPYGLEDLVGSVWQMTNDVYDNTTHRFIMLKGGSYFLPASSWWYVQGGPRELNYRQYLLRVSQGFERNATIGFRCIKDAL